MNVADKDLCQELYELSGWVSGEMSEGGFNSSWYTDEDELQIAPAYDAGYLLRKLPTHFKKYNSNYSGYYYKTVMQGHSEGGYLAGYFHNTNARHTATMSWLYSATADTPENALAKLCCELIREGVLKP